MIFPTFSDLHTDQGLDRIHNLFLSTNPPDGWFERAIHLQSFLENLFTTSYSESPTDMEVINYVRRNFVQRYALNTFPYDPDYRPHDLKMNELDWAKNIKKRFDSGENLEEEAKYSVWATHQDDNETRLFHKPQNRIWQFEHKKGAGKRDNFDLTDNGLDRAKAYSEAFYCIGCHKQNKDSCRTGVSSKNIIGTPREGCPLNQHISEMMVLARKGHFLAALAIAMIENPLVVATGHRICTSCMDSCIYQKLDPVNIPGTETFLVRELLRRPYGFEVYRLLTYWNPLQKDPLPLKSSGQSVLVVGLGPAGIMMSHQLLRMGHSVRAVDGLHIQETNSEQRNQLVENFPFQKLSERNLDGFGGVMSYGITARWDKNYLLALRLVLDRHPRFAMQGSVRFESTFSAQQAFDAGFDHISLCVGAGPPRKPLHQILKGSRFANDFLMSLHLNRKAPLIKPPCIVVGGGLTAIDAATEMFVWLRQQMGHDVPKNAVTLVYRKPFEESPSWRLNADEVRIAQKEGVHILDGCEPIETILEHDQVVGLRVNSKDGEFIVPALSIWLAIGTEPPTLDVLQDLSIDLSKETFMIKKNISVAGDAHPAYRGSVVQALASAKNASISVHQSLVGTHES